MGSSSSGGSGGFGGRGNQGGSGSGGQGPQQPQNIYMEMSLHLLEYRGIEDAAEHIHMCEILWHMKGIMASECKASQFTTTLQARTHSWYRKFDPNQTCIDYAALKDAFLKEFHIPEFEQKSISALKDIKQGTTESVREYDAHFKTLLSKLSYDIHASQHAQWFFRGLITPFRRALSHKTYTDPRKALEAALRAEVVGSIDTGVSPFLEAQIVAMAK
ncbi:hypothetical protein KI387_028497 [Taxus chinensis]|uniref:Retrotransposon gag domain-containing protein n=1 Tax=Taxus chinensis TaxID=29808 RepID=A0AA38FC72_TAXCH|nr:hypothetical protein KI387_028497 [Taxus chinensis]